MNVRDITNLPADELKSFMITMLDKIAKSGLTLNIGCGNTTHNYSNSNNTNTDNSVSNSYCNSHNTNKSTSYENIGNTSNTNTYTYTNSFNTNAMLTPGNNDVWEIIGDMCKNRTTYENIDGDVYKINPNKKTIKQVQSEVDSDMPSRNTNLGETIKSLLFDSLTVGTAVGTSYLSRRR